MNQSNHQNWRLRRDHKILNMLDPHEPAWLVEEDVQEENEVAYYTIVHRWRPGGWARRHYTYDIPGNVIHFRGSTALDDANITKMKPQQRIHHHHTSP